jgi:hypothetical protein
MSAGGLYLRFRQWSEHGMSTAYYRDIVRQRILRTAPVTGTIDRICELHVMTCRRDWLNLIWTLKSFYQFSKRHYALCIHEDGTLPPEGIGQLRRHFPDARLIRRRDADARLEVALRGYPRSLTFRRANVLALKLFDFAVYLEAERLALFDSDLLFFSEPTAYLQHVESTGSCKNVFNADFASAYTVSPEMVRAHAGLELQPRVNSGLGLIHRNSLRWDWIEEFLALPNIQDGHFWRIEQTLFALCSSRYGVELLPDEYTLYLEPGIGLRPYRHYVGTIRHLMYREGIARLTKTGFLNRSAFREKGLDPLANHAILQ